MGADSVMGRCRDCKHWGDPGVEAYSEAADDYIALPQRKCLAVPHLTKLEQAVLTTAPFVIDGEGYAASLRTPADFGCVQFEAKQ